MSILDWFRYGGKAVSSRYPDKYIIGLTGNIAVGKSVVCEMLQRLGAYHIDADKVGHQVIEPNAPAYKPIIETFGKIVVGHDGRINRKTLGNIVFSDSEALKTLESITHPIIRNEIDTLIKRSKQCVVVIEAIKLLEGDLKDAVDTVWVVNATPHTQYHRLISERNMSEQDAEQRILAQNKQADKLKQAHVVIQNDDNIDDTWQQVQHHWAHLQALLSDDTPSSDSSITHTQSPPTQP